MDLKTFTEPIIKGINHKTILPKGTALILEGGGTRSFYSAGVFEAFMTEGIMFPYIAAVSGGAANAMSYISGQPGRNRMIVDKYVHSKKYVGYSNLFRHKSLFGYDFIFNTVPNKHVFWDKDVFDSTDIRFVTGTTDCATGKPVWFEKEDINPDLKVTIASCSVPLVSKIVEHNGLELLDGGISAPIPIEKSIKDGNMFHVVILTRNQGFKQKEVRYKRLIKRFYKKYPLLVESIISRHEVYNKQLALCEQLEQEGKALIIRPQIPLTVGRSTSDRVKLLALHDEGLSEGEEAVRALRGLLNIPLKIRPVR